MDGSVDVWVDACGCGRGRDVQRRVARGWMEGKGVTRSGF